jgi:hypothetical protein
MACTHGRAGRGATYSALKLLRRSTWPTGTNTTPRTWHKVMPMQHSSASRPQPTTVQAHSVESPSGPMIDQRHYRLRVSCCMYGRPSTRCNDQPKAYRPQPPKHRPTGRTLLILPVRYSVPAAPRYDTTSRPLHPTRQVTRGEPTVQQSIALKWCAPFALAAAGIPTQQGQPLRHALCTVPSTNSLGQHPAGGVPTGTPARAVAIQRPRCLLCAHKFAPHSH